MAKILRRVKLELFVTVPARTGEAEVEAAINAALDEPPCEWWDWEVSAATIVQVERITKRKKVAERL